MSLVFRATPQNISAFLQNNEKRLGLTNLNITEQDSQRILFQVRAKMVSLWVASLSFLTGLISIGILFVGFFLAQISIENIPHSPSEEALLISLAHLVEINGWFAVLSATALLMIWGIFTWHLLKSGFGEAVLTAVEPFRDSR